MCSLLVLPLAVFLAAPATLPAQQPTGNDQPPLLEGAAYDPRIPSPDVEFGFALGSRPVRQQSVLSYFRRLAESSPRIQLHEYGRTHEGRALIYAVISSEENMARLEEIRQAVGLLGDPRPAGAAARAHELIETTPAVAWMAYSIHGDELSSTDAAVALAHYLVAGADEQAAALRRDLVNIIDPLMNPDGRERFLAQIESAQGRVENLDVQSLQHGGRWPWGRGNHYLFDMNRDWFAMTQPETAGRVREILRWNPQLLVDSHEMGPLETYLFYPAREPFNPQTSEVLKRWWAVFSRDQAAAFDRHGWSYYTREWSDYWYPGYSDSWASFCGAVSLLYEQAGVDGSAVRQRAGDVLTYRDAVRHHLTSSVANLGTLRANRKEIMRDFHQERAQACSPTTKRPYDAFVFVEDANAARLRAFLSNLSGQGLEVRRTTEPVPADLAVTADGETLPRKTFPAGCYVVRMDQPLGPLAAAILDFDPRMSDSFLNEEREELERKERSRMYDVSAWCLSMAYDVESYWVKGIPPIVGELVREVPAVAGGVETGPAAYGYVVDGRNDAALKALVDLFARGLTVRVAERDFTAGGRTFSRGSLLIRRHENAGTLPEAVQDIARDTAVRFAAVESALGEVGGPDLGGSHFWLLAPPKVAMFATPPIRATSFGAVWHLLDRRMGLAMSTLNTEQGSDLDLRKYNVLILPDGDGERTAQVLGKEGLARLTTWVKSGGTLVALGGSAAMLADESVGISRVRRRQDVLDKLSIYAEAVGLERAAMAVRVEPEKVWRYHPSTMPVAAAPDRKEDVEALKRRDEWQRRFSPRGTILRARVDREHWLTFGARDELPVFVSGSHALLSQAPVQTPLRFDIADRLRLSGLLWPEAAERLADSACVTVERVGDGQVILFHTDPTFRGYFHATQRMLLNAVLLGPGSGTSQPQPW